MSICPAGGIAISGVVFVAFHLIAKKIFGLSSGSQVMTGPILSITEGVKVEGP